MDRKHAALYKIRDTPKMGLDDYAKCMTVAFGSQAGLETRRNGLKQRYEGAVVRVSQKWSDFSTATRHPNIYQHWANSSTPKARAFVEEALVILRPRAKVEEQLAEMMKLWVDALADPSIDTAL
jgi:hypothetical protein